MFDHHWATTTLNGGERIVVLTGASCAGVGREAYTLNSTHRAFRGAYGVLWGALSLLLALFYTHLRARLQHCRRRILNQTLRHEV